MEIEGSYETLSFKSKSSFNSNRSLEKAFCRFLMTDLSLLECARYTNIALYRHLIISTYINISPHHHPNNSPSHTYIFSLSMFT